MRSTHLTVFLLALLSLTAPDLPAQDLAPQPFSFSWKAVAGAGGYLAEVRDLSENVVASSQTAATETKVSFPLVPGNYRLRLTTLNRFLKAESSTDWVPIHVSAAAAPQLGAASALIVSPREAASLELAATGLAQDATASLRSPTGKLLPLTLPQPRGGQVVLSIPALTERGAYDVLLTNPPRLTAVASRRVLVRYPAPTVDSAFPLDFNAVDAIQEMTVTGSDFSPDAVVRLALDGSEKGILLAIKSRTPTDLVVTFSAGNWKEGAYALSVANAPEETAVSAGDLNINLSPDSGLMVAASSRTPELGTLLGVASDRGGTLYIADADANVVKRALPVGQGYDVFVDKNPQTGSLRRPTGLATDSLSNLYIVDSGDAVIHKVSYLGQISTFARLPVTKLVPAGLARGATIDPFGTLFVTDPATDAIYSIDPKGKVSLLAGGAESGAIDGPLSEARFNHPQGIDSDDAGYLYVADTGNNSIRRISPDGNVTTLADETSFDSPVGVAVDSYGSVYVTEAGQRRLRRIGPEGEVTTVELPKALSTFLGSFGLNAYAYNYLAVADVEGSRILQFDPPRPADAPEGQFPAQLLAGNGLPMMKDGPAAAAAFNQPTAVVSDSSGTFFVSDRANNRIRMIQSGQVTTFAGSGKSGATNGGPATASFNSPGPLAIDRHGNLYVADVGNFLVRKITPEGQVSTLAGSAGKESVIGDLKGMTVDGNGNVYVTMAGFPGHILRKITPTGQVFPVSVITNKDAVLTALCADLSGNLFAIDAKTNRILKITVQQDATAVVSTLSDVRFDARDKLAFGPDGNLYVLSYGDGTTSRITPEGVVTTVPTVGTFQYAGGIAIDRDGSLLVADTETNAVRTLPLSLVATVNSTREAASVATVRLSGPLTLPAAVAADPQGDAWLADGNRILYVSASGALAHFAGSDDAGNKDGADVIARFNHPTALALGPEGTLYVADTDNNSVRKVSPVGKTTTWVQGLGHPEGLAVAPDGTVYVADTDGRVIKKITAAGKVSVYAGSGSATPADGPAASAAFLKPRGLPLDANGSLFVADEAGIRVVDTAGSVTTLVSSVRWKGGDIWNNAAKVFTPTALAWGPGGDLYVVDRGKNTIVRVTRTGIVRVVAGSLIVGKRDVDSGSFNRPTGIAVRSPDSFWVTDGLNQALRVVSLTEEVKAPGLFVNDAPNPAFTGVPVRKTIQLGKNLDSWAGMAPAASLPFGSSPGIPGTAVTAFYLAQDDRYLYWLMTTADGKPRGTDAINYILAFRPLNDRGNDVLQVKVGGGRDKKPYIEIFDDASQGRLSWRGSPTDYFFGDGFVQARFPLTDLKRLLKGKPELTTKVSLWGDIGNGMNLGSFPVGKLEF